jgi:Tol biopolymer transport system component
MISPEQLDRVKTLLAVAVGLKENERAEFVRAHSGQDQEVRQELQSLLELHAIAGDFLNTPLPELLGATAFHPPPPLASGTLVKERYRIRELLAASGFATVYLALDETVAEKPVVIKMLDRPGSQGFAHAAFEAELQSLSRLNHPHVAGLSDVGQTAEGTPYLVMSYVPGVTLREVLSSGPLPLARCRKVIEGVGSALAAAHRAGIWHLDVKPENIILSDAGTPEERVTLVDFGIAHLKALPGPSAGTSRYMAPEQTTHPGASCDTYSLALVMCEMLTGRLPDSGKPALSVSPVSDPVREAIAKALQRDPAQRHAGVADFVRDVRLAPAPAAERELLLITGLIALVVAGFLIWMPSRTARATAELRATPLITTPGFDYRPALTADGDWIYYAAGEDGRADIYKCRTAGGTPIPVVAGPDDDDRPAPSPDGKRLAYLRMSSRQAAIMLRALDGSGPEEELHREREIDGLCWHPDSRHLVVSRGPATEDWNYLEVFDTRTRSWAPLVPMMPGTRGDRHPAVAPDGHAVAFVRRWNQESADLFVVSIDDQLKPFSEARRVTFQNERITNVQWTPDSRELIYSAGPLGHARIKRVPSAGGSPQLLPGLDSDVERVTIPLRAWKLAYSVHRSDSNVWRIDLGSNAPPVPTRVIANTYDDEEAQLSPDGRWLAFSSGRSGSEQIWISLADGADARQITNIPGADSMSVSWSRDSTTLVISIRHKATGERVYLAPAQGEPQLTQILSNALATSLSRDGQWIYLRRRIKGERKIWKTEYPHPKTFIQVTAGPGEHAREAPDGQSLYYTLRREEDGIWRQTAPGGPAKRLVTDLYRRNLFAPAKDGLYYVARIPGRRFPGLFFRKATTGEIRLVTPFTNEVFWGFDLSEDERSVYYSQFDLANADIMFVNDFR